MSKIMGDPKATKPDQSPLDIQQEINALYPQAESKTVVLPEGANASESESPTRRSCLHGPAAQQAPFHRSAPQLYTGHKRSTYADYIVGTPERDKSPL